MRYSDLPGRFGFTGCPREAPTVHRNVPFGRQEPEGVPGHRDQKWVGEAGAGSRNVLTEFPIIDKYSGERKAAGDRHWFISSRRATFPVCRAAANILPGISPPSRNSDQQAYPAAPWARAWCPVWQP